MIDTALRFAHTYYYLASHGLTSPTGLSYWLYAERSIEIEFRKIHQALQDPLCGCMLDEIDEDLEETMDHACYAYYSVSHGKMSIDVLRRVFEDHPGAEEDFRELQGYHGHSACGQMLAEIDSVRVLGVVERCIDTDRQHP